MSDTDTAQLATTPSTAVSASRRRRPAQASGGLVSTAELRRRLTDPELAIVDVRSLSAYNGWRESGELRGGHVPGAVAFPSSWLALIDSGETDELLAGKGLTPEREIVLYGGRNDDVGDLARSLSERDYAHVRTYSHDWSTWASSRRLPVERLANHDKLVHPEWLRQVLAGERPEAAPTSRVALFHVNFGVPEEYEDGHIPGAFYLDTNWLESSHDWNRRSPEELDAAVRALGVTADTTVVLYGRDTEGDANEKWPGRRAGQIAASRAALILRYRGVDDIRLLDGGYDRWVREGSRSKPSCERLRPWPPSALPSRSGRSSSSTSRRRRRSWTTRSTRRSSAFARGPSTSER